MKAAKVKKKTQSNLHLNGDAYFLFQRLLLISFTLSVIRRQVLRRYRFQLFSFEIFLSLLVSRARSPMMNVLSPIKYKHEMNLWSHLFRSRLAGCYEIRHPRWLWKHSYRITFKVLLFDTPRTAPKSKKNMSCCESLSFCAKQAVLLTFHIQNDFGR